MTQHLCEQPFKIPAAPLWPLHNPTFDPESQEEAAKLQGECAADLAIAEPVIAEAEAALNSLDKASLVR